MKGLNSLSQHVSLNYALSVQDFYRTDFYDSRKCVLIIFVIFSVVFHYCKYV